jgi:endonuclease G
LYDTRNKSAHWIFEHLTFESVADTSEVRRSKSNYYEDEKVHPFFSASISDYKGSGFDKGHLAAARNHKKCQQDMNETFVLSNIAPQVGKGFNQNKWNDLENYIANQTKKYKNI